MYEVQLLNPQKGNERKKQNMCYSWGSLLQDFIALVTFRDLSPRLVRCRHRASKVVVSYGKFVKDGIHLNKERIKEKNNQV